MADQRHFVHVVDNGDVIVEVNAEWRQFAAENGLPELPDRALGTPLWSHIVGYETVHLYQILVEELRKSGRPQTLAYRCDSPRLRRYMEMRITRQGGGRVVFTSHIVALEERPEVRLLDAAAPRSEETLMICSWCKKIHVGEREWCEAESAISRLKLFGEAGLPKLSHGMCPTCYEEVMRQM